MNTIDLLRFVRDMQRPPGLGATDKQVLGAIAVRCNDALECWPSQTTIARDCWMSERAARDSLRRLEVAGLVTVRRRTVESSAERDTNVYRIVLDEIRKQAPHVGRHVPHVRHHVPRGGAPGAGQVGRQVPHGGAPGAGEVTIEVTNGSNQGRDLVVYPCGSPSTDPARELTEPPKAGQLSTPKPTKAKPTKATKVNGKGGPGAHIIAEIFAAWADARIQHHPRARAILDATRSKCIASRLADGFDVETLKHAAAGIWRDPFSLGQNDRQQEFTDITIALRDAAHVEKFSRIWLEAQLPAASIADAPGDWQPPPDALPPAENARRAKELIEQLSKKFDPNSLAAPKEAARDRT